MRLLLDMEHDFPGGEYPDVDYIVAKLRVEGSFLDVEEVVTLRRALAAIGGIVSFIISREERYPALHARTRGVAAFPEIVQRIDGILDRFGQVKDNASPALQEIRRSIREREGQAAKRLQAVLSAAKGAGIVDADAQISIRDGKAVIPVSAGNKRKLNGFIHDESATGKTFYVEPVEVVEINNELRELEYAERREVVRILTEFTEAIRPDAGLIADSGDYLAEIDMLRAKGRWASENGCVRPILSTDDRLVLKNARHPLLQQTLRAAGREIVPLDLQLDRRKRILVISGPNAGGKSVCLKTTGIVQYMFQCGFPVPVSEVSELPVFESIFIDIGDEQSIDNDLSTYSSHLLNMKHMLAGASGRTLVLIDEFGSGTEPVIGGAIAEAILERLLGRGCYGVITTHYANIKYYAASVEGIANGAMMFDVQNIRPLFRLEMGKPGSSFAVEIARKIGLPEDIIRAASEKAGSDHINIEKQLREIARDKHYWEQKRDRIRLTDRKVEELEQNYAEQLAKIRAERQEILKKAKQEARQLIADANKQIENTIKTIREAQAEKELTRLARRELDDFREAVEKADEAGNEAAVAREIERDETHFKPMIDMDMVSVNHEITAQLARSAVRASTNLPIKYVVLDTKTGRTGRYLAAFRGRKTVMAVCYQLHAQRILALSYGVVPILRNQELSDRYHFLVDALEFLDQYRKLDDGDLMAIVGGSFGPDGGASYVEIANVQNIRKRNEEIVAQHNC